MVQSISNFGVLSPRESTPFLPFVTSIKSVGPAKVLIERLKKVGCPEQVISEVIGLAKKESFYGNETTLDIKSSWLSQLVHI